MTVFLVAEQEVLLAGFRFTTQVNQIAEAITTAELDASALGSLTQVNEPGLKGYGFSGEGFWEGGALGMDAAIHDRFRTRNVPFSLCLTDGSVSSPARSVKAMVAEYQTTGQHGELLGVNFSFAAMDAPVRGTVLHNSEETGNVTGTAVQLGAATASQFLYGTLHVFSGSGELVVKIQSASDEAFTSPNDRITFATVLTGTAQASEWATPVAGAITDTWWRVTATNPATRDFAVVAAIQ